MVIMVLLESNASNGGMHAHVNLLSDKEAL